MRGIPDWIETLERFQLAALVEVHEAAGAMFHRRELLRRAMMRARCSGLSVEQLAEVTGLTPEGVRVVLRRETPQFRGLHPTASFADGAVLRTTIELPRSH